MEDFRNLRTTAIPEIGVTNAEIDRILTGIKALIAKNEGWPSFGTCQIVWQEIGCKAREIIWCNFAKGKAEYRYAYSSTLSSGSGDNNSDDMVERTMTKVLDGRLDRSNGEHFGQIITGLYEHCDTYGIEDALVLNMMEGRIIIAMNTMVGVMRISDYLFNEIRKSEQHRQLRSFLFGLSEIMNAVLEVDALYRLGINGDTVLRKSMALLYKEANQSEKKMMQYAKESMMLEKSEAELRRCGRLQELIEELTMLRNERLSE